MLEDGTELPADLVVYATGYNSMNGWAADLISQEVADRVGKVWGLGSDTTKDPGPWEGEQRNMWKPTQQEALWFHGGNLHQSRYYSLFLALQLKARAEGIDTPVYGAPGGPPHRLGREDCTRAQPRRRHRAARLVARAAAHEARQRVGVVLARLGLQPGPQVVEAAVHRDPPAARPPARPARPPPRARSTPGSSGAR